MVTPADILKLALELSGREDETSIRSGISRAYYAAFLHCRAQLSEGGVLVVRGAGSDHRAVQDAVTRTNQAIGHALLQLRNMRNQADYDLSLSFSGLIALAMCAAARIVLTFMEAAADDDGAENADPSS